MGEHVISMEQSLSTKVDGTNSETSTDHDQSIVLTEATQNQSTIVSNEKNEEISNDRQEKALTYLKSILDNDDQLINNKPQRNVPCLKVPPKLRNNERSKDYYDPKTVSFGPYHHGKAELRQAQTIKTTVMSKFISEHQKSIQDLYIEVCKLNDHVRSCYVDGSTSAYGDEEFALMMLQDGCFILFLIEWRLSKYQKNKESLNSKSGSISMINNHLGILEVKYLSRDLLLLENQIPFKVLNVLMSNIYEENKGLTMIKSYLYRRHWQKFQKEDTRDVEKEEPVHLLGLLKTLISKGGGRVENVTEKVHTDATQYLQSFGSVSDLKAKWINFKPSNSISLQSALLNEKPKSISLRDVDFRSRFFFTRELKLPPLILTSNSRVYYSNLIAFEMCGTTDATVSSYISFMNSLIANPEDVKVLRSKRIILHTRSSDEEVFKMLKEISVTIYHHDLSIFQGVRQDIEKHYNNKIKIWIAEICHKYFSKPWSLIGLLFAVVGLILTFLSTFNSFKSI